MAQLDGSFYLQSQGPDVFGGFERGMRLGEMVRQRKAQELEQQKQNDIKDAYNSGYETRPDGSSFFNPQRVSEYLKSKGLGLEAQKFDQDYQTQQAAQLKSQVEAQQNQNAFVSNILGSVRDQASYAIGKKRAVDAGIPGADQLPDVYDPKFIDGLRKQYGMGSMSYAQQSENERKAKESEMDAELKRAQIAKMKAEAAQNTTSTKLTDGEKSADKDYGKEYSDFKIRDEKNAENAIKQLGVYKKMLEDEEKSLISAGGGMASVLPDAARFGKSIEIRDGIKAQALLGLRGAFGGNPTEGERIANAEQFYNDKLGNKQNIALLDSKIKAMKDGLARQKALAKHWEKNKTLSGFEPTQQLPQEIPPDVSAKIQSFMQKNGIKDQQEAIRILKENGRL